MKIKTKIILPHIYLLNYSTRYELCMSFVRMQEFYECASSKFRGKYFKLEDYIDYWSLNFGDGCFTYPGSWSGFNLPGKVIDSWVKKFYDLRLKEKIILDKVANLMAKEYKNGSFKFGDPYYVIGVHSEKDEDDLDGIIDHETAHAIYNLYPEYSKSCEKLLDSIPNDKIKEDSKILLDMGYSKTVIRDELQAYYSCANDTISALPEFTNNFNEFKKSLKYKNKSK